MIPPCSHTSAAMASSSNSIRVRLLFDYPPPAGPDRRCWMLVDLRTCRVVLDLVSIIRERFGFSRRNMLSLFIEDCFLPPTESVCVVRDNDSVRVKVGSLNGLEANHHPSPGNVKKRGRETEEEGPEENGCSVEWKKKKRKSKKEASQERESEQTVDKDGHGGKLKNKKAKRKKEEEGKVATSTKAPSDSISQPEKSSKKTPAAAAPTPVSVKGKAAARTPKAAPSDSSDSSSEEEEAPKKTPTPKPPPKTPSSALPAATKVNQKAKMPPAKLQPPPSSSSSETDSSLDEAVPSKAPVKPPLKNAPLAKPAASTPKTSSSTSKGGAEDKNTPSRTQAVDPSSPPTNSSPAQRPTANGSTQPSKKVPEQSGRSDSDSTSEEEIRLVIKRPTMGMGMAVAPASADPSLRGRGRACPRGGEWGRGNRRGEGRGGGRGGDRGVGRGFYLNYEEGQQQQQPSFQRDALTNNSVFIQNPADQRDYSAMPLLAGPPQLGQRIAFKLLELTENYTPEVSEYKEGKLISFDPTSKQIELELLFASQAPVEPGKFDLVYQNADGSESVEYAVSRGSRVTERWESLLEPRLII